MCRQVLEAHHVFSERRLLRIGHRWDATATAVSEDVVDASRAQPEPYALGIVETRELVSRPSAREAAVVEVEHVIRDPFKVVDPMLCHEYGGPCGLPARNCHAKLRDCLEVEVRRRLVQHDERGRRSRGACARHALLLTARERKEAFVDQGC